ncbi:MAG: M28 family peptidase, partial [Promethearchaeota archaeon]
SVKNVSIIDNEPSTRTRHSIQVVEKLRNAAKKIHLDLFQESLGGSSKLSKILGQITGGTDATAFSKANVKAASIVAMDLKKMLDFYHQPSDTIDKIERGALERVLKLCLSYLKVSN